MRSHASIMAALTFAAIAATPSACAAIAADSVFATVRAHDVHGATADWPAINAVAVVDGSGNVIAWKSLATAIYVTAGKAARIPAGAWFFYTPSV